MKRTYYLLFVLGVVLTVTAVVARTILIPGFIHFRDVTEKSDVTTLYERYIYTYSNDIGESLAEKARIPLFYLIFGIYKVFNTFGLGNEYYVKIKIFFLFLSSFFAFMLTARKLIEKFIPSTQYIDKKSAIFTIPPVLGALFYVTNFWFTNRIAHFGLFFATVTVPLVFYLLFDYFFSEKRDLRKLLVLSLVLGIFTATPHTVLFEILIFVSIFLAYLITQGAVKDKYFTPIWHLLVFFVTTLLVNLYWILPYMVSNSKPDAEVSETIVKLIGKYATIENALGLRGYWLTELDSYFLKGPLLLVSFFPLLFLVALFVGLKIRKEHRLFLSMLILFILGTFLSTSGNLTNLFYFKIMFDSPLKSTGWLFREYDKFGLILSFLYSLAITVIFYLAFKTKKAMLVVVFPFASVIIINLLFLNKTLETNYEPATIPDSYNKVVSILNKDNEQYNVLWYPGNPKPFWVSGEEVRYTFTNLISPKPAITTKSELINYANYLFNPEEIYSIDIGKALDLIGVKYLIIRKDESVFKSGRLDDLLNTQNSIRKVFSDELITLYENTAFTGITKVYNSKITTNTGLRFLTDSIAQKYNNGNTYIDFTDRPSGITLDNTEYLLKPEDILDAGLSPYSGKLIFPAPYSHKKEDGNPGNWKTGSLENVNHAEVDFFLSSLGLNIKQFDYGKGVVIARNGWQLSKDVFSKGKQVGIMFSGHENVRLSGNNLKYSSRSKDFIYYWNTIRSDRFDVKGRTSLGLRFHSNIPENLIPHFKFTFYSQDNTILAIIPMYQDERGLMENIVKIPANAETGVFSIWTISKEPDQEYSYALSNFEITDLTDVVQPISMTFRAKTGCSGNCNLYVRALKSNIGGEIRVDARGKEFNLITKTPDLEKNDRYAWELLGKTENTEETETITLKNMDGFNSVNALLFLSDSEMLGLPANLPQVDPALSEEIANNAALVETKQINPTKYEIKVLKAPQGKSVLAFAKPQSKNWILEQENSESKLINGYINGWEVNNLKEGTYTVVYKPQKYFNLGAIISATVAGIILLTLVITYSKSPSASERKSNSQG